MRLRNLCCSMLLASTFCAELEAGLIEYSWGPATIRANSAGTDPWGVGISGKPIEISLTVDTNATDLNGRIDTAEFGVTDLFVTIGGVTGTTIDPGDLWFVESSAIGDFAFVLALFSTVEFGGNSRPFSYGLFTDPSAFTFTQASEQPPLFDTTSAQGRSFNDSYFIELLPGATMTAALIPEPSTLANLDIKPGSDPNSVNLKSRGVLPVALLTTDDFDALQVDLTTIVFGDPLLLSDGAIGVAPLRSGEEDVNGDGLIDLTLKFSMRDLVDNGALGGMSMEALLTGLTFDGMMFEASDSIRLVPPGDANNDLVVDAADYTVWANGFGGASPQLTDGDFNGDGSVDVADYTILANHFGQGVSTPAGAVAAVPEPSSLTLAALGLVGLLAYGWPRRRGA